MTFVDAKTKTLSRKINKNSSYVEKIQTSQLNPVGRGAWVLGKLIRHAYVRDSEG